MFQPSERSRATILHRYVREHMADVGDTITYDEIAAMLGMDFDGVERASLLTANLIGDVNRRLHREGDWRHLVNVPTVGYCVASPEAIRVEVANRLRHIERTQASALRATEKGVRHPDATVAERRRAADAAAAQSALLALTRRENRKVMSLWPADEVSPVEPEVTA